jgi:hypothetical protein
MRVIMQAARDIASARGGFGVLGGGQAPQADAGEYTVVLKAGDAKFRQNLHVIKGPNAGGGGGPISKTGTLGPDLWYFP